MDCLSDMIALRRKTILNVENYLKQQRETLSPEQVVQIEKDLADIRLGLHNMEADYHSIAGEPYTDKRNS